VALELELDLERVAAAREGGSPQGLAVPDVGRGLDAGRDRRVRRGSLWRWALRRRLWNVLAVAKFEANKPAIIPMPRPDPRQVEAVSMASRHPDIPLTTVLVGDHVPRDEFVPVKYFLACRVQSVITRHLSRMDPGLPPVDAAPQAALDAAYTRAHRRRFPAPILPEAYARDVVDLGELAVASPYACCLSPAPEGGYRWELGHLGGYEHHPGVRSLGARVRFALDEGAHRLRAVEIDCDLGVCTPDDPRWVQAQRLALCAATTEVTIVRHTTSIHFATAAHLAMATRNHLAATHPLRRFLTPHVYGTQASNEYITAADLAPGADFEAAFSFTHRGMWQLLGDAYDAYDSTVIDPERDAERRGLLRAGLDAPAWRHLLDHLEVMRAHALRYLQVYYDSDGALDADAAVRSWLDELDRLIPNGVRALVGPRVTLEGLSRFLGACLHYLCVQHEMLGSGLWNYQLWTRAQPVRVYENGQRVPVDVYQRLVNYNFLLNVHRTMLMSDFSYLALDPAGAAAFRAFRDDLRRLQAALERTPFQPWMVYPSNLKANINA
jgi:hypothetical protein